MKYFLHLVLISLIASPFVSLAESNLPGDYPPETVSQSTCVNLQTSFGIGSRDISTNGAVSSLQQYLGTAGYYVGDPTGYFGVVTLGAVKKFQSAQGFAQTGYVGPLTRASIQKLSCSSVPTIDTSSDAYKDAKIAGINASITARIASLQPIAEILYDAKKSYASLCRSGFINASASAETPALIQGIISAQGTTDQKSAGISCASSKEKYAVQVVFKNFSVKQNRRSVCVDNAGAFGSNTQYIFDKNSISCKSVGVPAPTITPVSVTPVIETAPISGTLAITKISGPTTLRKGEKGTWSMTTNASSLRIPVADTLYTAEWNDTPNAESQYSGSFSHVFPNAGLFAVRFQITHTRVGGYGSAFKTLYVKVTDTNPVPISITSPSGGQVYKVGDTLNIRWIGGMRAITLEDPIHRVSRSITQIRSNSASDTSGSFNYVIPADVLNVAVAQTFVVRVYSSLGTSYDDIFETTEPFTIQSREGSSCPSGKRWNGTICELTPVITINSFSQNSATPGTAIKIYGSGFLQSDRVYFVANQQVAGTAIPTSVSSSQISIVVPSITAKTYGVMVARSEDLASKEVPFTVTAKIESTPTPTPVSTCSYGKFWNGTSCVAATVRVTSPNGGEVYYRGSAIPITWTTNADASINTKILIERYDDKANSGSPVTAKTIDTKNTGSYNLMIDLKEVNDSFPCSNGCLNADGNVFGVRVILSTTGVPNDISDSRFSILGR